MHICAEGNEDSDFITAHPVKKRKVNAKDNVEGNPNKKAKVCHERLALNIDSNKTMTKQFVKDHFQGKKDTELCLNGLFKRGKCKVPKKWDLVANK